MVDNVQYDFACPSLHKFSKDILLLTFQESRDISHRPNLKNRLMVTFMAISTITIRCKVADHHIQLGCYATSDEFTVDAISVRIQTISFLVHATFRLHFGYYQGRVVAIARQYSMI